METMGVGELYGCDVDILPIINRIPPGSDFVDVQTFLQHAVVEILLEKLDDGCTTVLVDVDKLDGTPAAVLIPRIHELRVKEMHNISIPVLGKEIVIFDIDMNEIGTEIIPDNGESVLLRDVWLTALGHETLSRLGIGLRSTVKDLDRIKIAIKKAGFKFQLKKVTKESGSMPLNMSEAMANLILKGITSNRN